MALTLIIDIGNYGTRVAYEKDGEMVIDSFSSLVTLYRELEEQGEMVDITFLGHKYLTGEGVENFFEGKDNRMYMGGDKKGHPEGVIRLIHALYRVYKATNINEFNIVLLSPFKSLKKDEAFFKKYFLNEESFIVNGNPFSFKVNNLGFAAEGLGAYRYATKKNVVLFDVGSGTWNVITMRGGTIQRDDTFTITGGTIGNTIYAIATEFQKLMKNLDYTYEIVVSGGQAPEVASNLELLGYENVIVPKVPEEKYYLTNIIGLYEQHYKSFLKKWNDD